jgi:hypothetical protein
MDQELAAALREILEQLKEMTRLLEQARLAGASKPRRPQGSL